MAIVRLDLLYRQRRAPDSKPSGLTTLRRFSKCLVHLPAVVVCVLLSMPTTAFADRIGTIKVPEVFPDLINPPQFPPLLDPLPLNGSWAEPNHHPLGVHLDNYSLTREQIDAAQSTGCKLVRLAIRWNLSSAAPSRIGRCSTR